MTKLLGLKEYNQSYTTTNGEAFDLGAPVHGWKMIGGELNCDECAQAIEIAMTNAKQARRKGNTR